MVVFPLVVVGLFLMQHLLFYPITLFFSHSLSLSLQKYDLPSPPTSLSLQVESNTSTDSNKPKDEKEPNDITNDDANPTFCLDDTSFEQVKIEMQQGTENKGYSQEETLGDAQL